MARKHIDRVDRRMKTGTTLTSATNVLYSGGGGLSAANINAAVAENASDVSGLTSGVNYLTYSVAGGGTDTINFVVRHLNTSATLITTSTQRVVMRLYDSGAARPVATPRAGSTSAALVKVNSISVGTAIAGGPPTTHAETFIFSLASGLASIVLVNASSTVGIMSSATWYAEFQPVTSSTLGAQQQSHPILVPFTWR